MIARLRNSGLLWLTACVVPAIFVLVALGNWQWSRMHWKQALLSQLAAAQTADPIAMQVVPRASDATGGRELEAIRFRRIAVRGTFEHGHEMHVWAPARSGPAWSVVTPFRLDTDQAGRAGLADSQASHLLVIRGVVPQASKSVSKRLAGQIGGAQTVTGRVRLDAPNDYANAPDVSKNQWFTRDLMKMSAQFQKETNGSVHMAPFFLEADTQIGGPLAPKPDLKALILSNRHLEYALTWWALAATLAAVFAVYVISRFRSGTG